eukprot:GSChrysophyteH1.ASY1.ANO1.631.1 assembled CDS
MDNLGNTCYLNSSLQALFHTEHLMDYFLIAGLNSQFAGYQQQDAQELLDFLLVGLSEDLNLVEDKPYVEMPDSDDRPESELADIWWDNHQKRDLSVVTSLFSGQFRSSTSCSCGHSSIRYEPFTLLSVAIPELLDRIFNVHVASRSGTVRDLLKRLLEPSFPLHTHSVKDALDSRKIVVADVAASRIRSLVPLDQSLDKINDSDNLFFFEVCTPDKPLTSPIHGLAAFVQRKIRLSAGGGLANFHLHVFGLPMMEVVSSNISGRELYSIVGMRVQAFINGSIDQLKSTTMGQFEYEPNNSGAGEFEQGNIRPIENEKAVGGMIPPLGFLLRFVVDGTENVCSCSRCPWIARWLEEGQTIAIDWHMLVFEEMIDTAAIMKVEKHESAEKTAKSQRLPLYQCLEKFTENERLEGFVCSKCKSDENMKRHFKFWRLPPILVIQLKRFQFNQTSRKKLNNHIDIPQEGLDLEPVKKIVKDNEKATGNTIGCTEYDLYAVVHHIGALGGGHYVATTRESRKPHSSPAMANLSDRWLLFNDGQVSSISDNNDVTSASAYVLFYKRRDV